MKRCALRAVAVLAFFSIACADARGRDGAAQRSPVIGGEVSDDADDAVVRVVARQPEPYVDLACSGVLVAPNVLVTALHCVAVFDANASFGCRPDGTLVASSRGGWIGEALDPGLIEVSFGTRLPIKVDARGVRVLGTGSTAVCIDDIAFVVLDTALPSAGLPVRVQRPVVAGESMTVIGFGQSAMPGVVRARRAGVPVLVVGPDDTSSGVGVAAPRTFIVGDGPCAGDNGAPALSDESGAVTGVFAFNFSGECERSGTRGWFTKLAPFANLQRDAFELAGQQPQEEGVTALAAPSAETAGCALSGANDGAASMRALTIGCAARALAWLRRRQRRQSRAARRS